MMLLKEVFEELDNRNWEHIEFRSLLPFNMRTNNKDTIFLGSASYIDGKLISNDHDNYSMKELVHSYATVESIDRTLMLRVVLPWSSEETQVPEKEPICNKCTKKPSCKFCDGSMIEGCIEFAIDPKIELKEIKGEILELIAGKVCAADFSTGIQEAIKIINKHIERYNHDE